MEGSLSRVILNWGWETMVALEFHTSTFLSAFLSWQLLDNWSGILFWFSNCSGIVGLPSIINCSWPWCISGGIQVTDHLFGICLLFDILYLLWHLLFGVYVFSICLAVVFNFYSLSQLWHLSLSERGTWRKLHRSPLSCDIFRTSSSRIAKY